MSRRVTESGVIKGDFKRRDHVSSKALILGGDQCGIRIADLLKRNGFDATLLVGLDDAYPVNSTLDVIQGEITQIFGFIGNFDVRIRTFSDQHDARFGFIIAAQPTSRRSKTDAFSLAYSDKIYSLSEFKHFLDSGGKFPKSDGIWRHIAFFFDLKGASEVSQFETLLSILDRLEMFNQVQSYIFTRNLKVASVGLEARYRYHRQHGVVFFKFDEADPQIVQKEKGHVIEFVEPLLREEMELTPDVIVIDEILSPADSLEPILKMIPSSLASAPYLQPESTRFNGVETQKAGVYAVGPSRGFFDQESLTADVDAVVVSLLKALPELSNLTQRQAAFVDPNKCTFCLTCFRLCPHGAIGFHSYPEVDPLSCKVCGLCVVECPMSAIEIHCGDSGTSKEQTTSFISSKVHESGRVKLFVCSHSGLQAVSKIHSALLSDVEICELPCAGSLDPNSVLKNFRNGIDGIIVAGCFKGNCASIYGSILAEERVAQAVKTLKYAGISTERLEFTYVAGNTPERIIDAILRVKDQISNQK